MKALVVWLGVLGLVLGASCSDSKNPGSTGSGGSAGLPATSTAGDSNTAASGTCEQFKACLCSGVDAGTPDCVNNSAVIDAKVRDFGQASADQYCASLAQAAGVDLSTCGDGVDGSANGGAGGEGNVGGVGAVLVGGAGGTAGGPAGAGSPSQGGTASGGGGGAGTSGAATGTPSCADVSLDGADFVAAVQGDGAPAQPEGGTVKVGTYALTSILYYPSTTNCLEGFPRYRWAIAFQPSSPTQGAVAAAMDIRYDAIPDPGVILVAGTYSTSEHTLSTTNSEASQPGKACSKSAASAKVSYTAKGSIYRTFASSEPCGTFVYEYTLK